MTIKIHTLIRRAVSAVWRLTRWFASSARIVLLRVKNPCLELPFSVSVGRALQIGRAVSIGSFSQISVRGGRCIVGRNTELGQGCVIACQEKVEIGARTLIAEYVTVRDQDHVLPGRASENGESFLTSAVKIGDEVWIGAKATVLRGSTMGNCSTLGAHGLLKGLVPENTVAVGLPAKVVEENSP